MLSTLERAEHIREWMNSGRYGCTFEELQSAIAIKSQRTVSYARHYACVYYYIMIVFPSGETKTVKEIGPYKWSKPSSLYYSEQERKNSLAGAKDEKNCELQALKTLCSLS